MNRYVGKLFAVFALIALALPVGQANAQGVTTGAITGTVSGPQGPVVGANVVAEHGPSGTRYGALTRADGRFSIPGMRVGGPYRVTVSSIGFENATRENVTVSLGVSTPVEIGMRVSAVEVEGITVTAEQEAILSPDRTGAATSVAREALATLPTISRRIDDFARLTPQYSGGPFGFSFAGQDNRLNNMTVDGSYFNNSFGLAGQPGDRTGVAPISIDAIEQVQINIAPYDVRQGNFVGAGVNTVTRSGTNDFRGSLFYQFRNEDFVGTQAKALEFVPAEFDFSQIGGWVSGPILQNKLFFFASFEDEGTTEPGSFFRPRRASGETGNVSRVLASDLETLGNYLSNNFKYEPGPFENYSFETPGTRFLGKLDYNYNERNKFSLRYTHLDSEDDVLASTSSGLGFGRSNRGSGSLGFANTNYGILENIRSVIGEWNSIIGDNKANNLILGYTYQDESRNPKGTLFPFVDVLDGAGLGATGSSAYTFFGFEPFTPNNELRYSTFQLQDNFTIFGDRHTWTFGLSAERYESENVFFPGSQSAYVYNSLADFYADADNFLTVCGTNPDSWSNCNRPTTPRAPRRFQVRYNNIPGQEKPIQPLEVFYGGIYGQDEYQVNEKLKVTAGLRLDVPVFGNTAIANPNADALTFRDEHGLPVQYQSGELPDPRILFSPRLGFNYDVTGDRSTQIRGGTGVFTGRPAYVWISNQIGNTGMLTGFIDCPSSSCPINTRGFHPDPNHYKPTDVTGTPASNYELALTDSDFKFPQIWRTNLAVDRRLPWGFVGSLEGLYNMDVNGIYYINANLPAPQSLALEGSVTSPVSRPRWTSTRIHSHVANAIVLKNQNDGYSWNLAGSIEKAFSGGLFAKGAYSYGESKNTVDPSSIAFSSWNGNENPGDPNNPGLGFSDNSPGHRAFLALSYRKDWFKFGGTSISLFAESRNIGNTNYTYAGDINGDGTSFNDLIFIPRDKSDMNFVTYTQAAVTDATTGEIRTPARTFTAQEQADAWEAYIEQDPYLSEHRGEIMKRGGVFLPRVFRADFAIEQQLFANVANRRNGISIRADILNFTNFLNSDWGVAQRVRTTQPLMNATVGADRRVSYRLRNFNRTGSQHELLGTGNVPDTFDQSVSTLDVYRIMFSLRYTFN
ncbi:MAG: TonB-dependent receptor [Gemmatimonadota bacterium]